jgi:hypothetical protein
MLQSGGDLELYAYGSRFQLKVRGPAPVPVANSFFGNLKTVDVLL